MKIFDARMNEITDPDLSIGRLEERSKPIMYHYVIDVPEEAHEETIAEYPNGGKDVVFVVDVEEQGHWEARDGDGNIIETEEVIPSDAPHEIDISSEFRWLAYVLLTPDELEAAKEERQALAEAQAAAEARETFMDRAPDILAEQDAAICDLYEQSLAMQAESDQAITELYEMFLEVTNG